jgi:hypothetical protein
MSDQHEHVGLMVEGAPPGKTQPVEVEAISANHYRVLYSPGFVEGIAAGDTIRIIDRGLGLFEVVSRGGNVAIKFARSRTFCSSYRPSSHCLGVASTEPSSTSVFGPFR